MDVVEESLTTEQAATGQTSDPIAEHLATRQACGLFDFSFMGAWELTGRDAPLLLERLQSRDVRLFGPDQIAYTLMCRDDGSVFNDATVWMFSPERYWLFSGRKSDAAWINESVAALEVAVTQIDGQLAVLALQGPHSGRLLARLMGESAVRELAYFRFCAVDLFGVPCQLGRIGYSGELGYEIVVDATAAAHLWQGLREAGARYSLRECGFDAANSLRIESGYILFSHELAQSRMPGEIGLTRLVTSVAPQRRGYAASVASAAQPDVRLVCVELESASVPSDDNRLPSLELTSSAFCPTTGKQLGLGFAAHAHGQPGTALRTQDGVRATVCALPRYDPARQRPRAEPLW